MVFGLLGLFWDDFFRDGFVFEFFGVEGSGSILINFVVFEFPSDVDEDFGFAFEEVRM